MPTAHGGGLVEDRLGSPFQATAMKRGACASVPGSRPFWAEPPVPYRQSRIAWSPQWFPVPCVCQWKPYNIRGAIKQQTKCAVLVGEKDSRRCKVFPAKELRTDAFVIGGFDNQNLFTPKATRNEFIGVNQFIRDYRQIQRPVQYLVHLRPGIRTWRDAEVNMRVEGLKLAEHLGKAIRDHGLWRTNRKRAGKIPLFASGRLGLFRQREKPVRVIQHLAADLRQQNLPAEALEQRNTQFMFQTLDVGGNARLE